MKKNPEIFYHYCSTDTFHKIISSRTIWLSSFVMSNDFKEGKVIDEIVARLCKKNNLPTSKTEDVLKVIDGFRQYFDSVGFCFSEDGDLLSQWRGYADDGRGVSIGFGREFLEGVAKLKVTRSSNPIKFSKLHYKSEELENDIQPIFKEAISVLNDRDYDLSEFSSLLDIRTAEEVAEDVRLKRAARGKLFTALLPIIDRLYTIKSSAFQEEKEWRLISLSVLGQGKTLQYQVRRDQIVPFDQVDFSDVIGTCIKEVILGPKHRSRASSVLDFLKLNGCESAAIRNSEASYQ